MLGARGRLFQIPRNEVNRMPEPTYEELKARVAEVEKQKRTGVLQFKVGEKGGVSAYGLGPFPVTLYYEQWLRLLDTAQGLRNFLYLHRKEGDQGNAGYWYGGQESPFAASRSIWSGLQS